MKKSYDCYVVLRRVHRGGRLIPGVGAYRRDDIPDWRTFIGEGADGVWLVEGATKSTAADLVLAHLAGHAPHGVTRLWRPVRTGDQPNVPSEPPTSPPEAPDWRSSPGYRPAGMLTAADIDAARAQNRAALDKLADL